MSAPNKSVSEVMRIIKRKISDTVEVRCGIFNYPEDKAIACSLGITQINDTKKTSSCLAVNLSLCCDCRVSRSEKRPSLKAAELAMSVFELLKDSFIGVCGTVPANIQAFPFSEDDSAAEWQVFWDQTFYVERFNDQQDIDED